MSARRRDRVGGGKTSKATPDVSASVAVPAPGAPSPAFSMPRPSTMRSARSRTPNRSSSLRESNSKLNDRGDSTLMTSPVASARPHTSTGTARDKSRIFAATATSTLRNETRSPSGPPAGGVGESHDMVDDPEEFLMRLQKQRDRDRRRGGATESEEKEGEQLNAYSRPMMSKLAPLRSNLLDPGINNFPRSKHRSELAKKVKKINMPHISYDIDGDGYVSQEDYFLAKRFDLDGNGLLDPDEQEVGRYIMAQEFFRNHRDDVHLYGPEWNQSEKKNIESLATAQTFQKLLNKLKETEKHYRDIGSQGTTACLTSDNKSLTQHNYYVDKFDTTAWNDFGANPRKYDPFANDATASTHGSREKMYHLRKINARETCQMLLDQADAKKPKFSNRRISLMTNWQVENS